jgi:hypothetical protein
MRRRKRRPRHHPITQRPRDIPALRVPRAVVFRVRTVRVARRVEAFRTALRRVLLMVPIRMRPMVRPRVLRAVDVLAVLTVRAERIPAVLAEERGVRLLPGPLPDIRRLLAVMKCVLRTVPSFERAPTALVPTFMTLAAAWISTMD